MDLKQKDLSRNKVTLFIILLLCIIVSTFILLRKKNDNVIRDQDDNKQTTQNHMKKIISTTEAPAAIGPYSQAIEANGMLFLSGQIPMDPGTGDIMAGDIFVQTEQVIKNLSAVLQAAGYTLDDVVKTTCYLSDMNEFQQFNEVYARYFTQKPARATVEVSRLPRDVKVEVEAIAVRDE